MHSNILYFISHIRYRTSRNTSWESIFSFSVANIRGQLSTIRSFKSTQVYFTNIRMHHPSQVKPCQVRTLCIFKPKSQSHCSEIALFEFSVFKDPLYMYFDFLSYFITQSEIKPSTFPQNSKEGLLDNTQVLTSYSQPHTNCLSYCKK